MSDSYRSVEAREHCVKADYKQSKGTKPCTGPLHCVRNNLNDTKPTSRRTRCCFTGTDDREKCHRSITWATTRIQIRSNGVKRSLESSITIRATCPARPRVQKKASLSLKPPLMLIRARDILILKANDESAERPQAFRNPKAD